MFVLDRSKQAISLRYQKAHNTPLAPLASSRRSLARHRKTSTVVKASADPDDLHETKLGPNVAAGIKDVKERLQWSPATVIRNE